MGTCSGSFCACVKKMYMLIPQINQPALILTALAKNNLDMAH